MGSTRTSSYLWWHGHSAETPRSCQALSERWRLSREWLCPFPQSPSQGPWHHKPIGLSLLSLSWCLPSEWRELWIRTVQETPTWLPPEVVGKSLLWKISCISDLNVASLRTSCHGIRRWHASFQRREATNSPTQPRCLRTITMTCKDNNPKHAVAACRPWH